MTFIRRVKRTGHPSIEKIERSAAEIEKHLGEISYLELAVQSLKEEISVELGQFAEEQRNEGWIETLRYLFFSVPYVPPKVMFRNISGAGGMTKAFRALVGKAQTDLKCEVCSELIATEHQGPYRKYQKVASGIEGDLEAICETCKEEMGEDERRRREELRISSARKYQLLQKELLALPYHQYRDSAHFRSLQRQNLHIRGPYNFGDTPGCQQCSANYGLDIYHRSRQSVKALQYGEDVMVLCNSCYPKLDSIGLVLNIDVDRA